MDKLKVIIEQYSRWKPLESFVSRIEAYRSSDYVICVENSKSLLESIGKDICQDKGIKLDADSTVNGIIKQAFKALGYSSNNHNLRISSALATIAQCLGELRNEIGTTSHGRTMQELEKQKGLIDDMTKEFLLGATELVSCLLINLSEKESVNPVKESMVSYEESEEFNQFWDEAFGDFVMGEYSYTASEVLYNMDYGAYKEELEAFNIEQKEENDEQT
jgi:hypothetical protein